MKTVKHIMREARTVDAEIENHGSIFLLSGISQDAKDWIDSNLSFESWQTFGSKIAIDSHYIGYIADGMIGDGLKVR